MLNLDEEARLYTSNADRDRWDHLANLYGIVVALDQLERAYIRDSVQQTVCVRTASTSPDAPSYTRECTRLLAQYKTIFKLVGDAVTSLEAFVSEYRMDCAAAVHRLKVGVPATVEHSAEEGVETAKWIAETTQSFITFMDALKLKLRAKDQLHPILTELMGSYSKFAKSAEWEGRPKLLSWLIKLNAMNASDEITEEQSRELLFVTESAYQEFYKHLR